MSESAHRDAYLPPTAEEATQFHQDIEPWVESLADRHGMGGRLKELPYDPEKYDFQRLDKGIIKARIPSAGELDEVGRDQLYGMAITKLKAKGHEAVGEEKYEAVVQDLINHDGGQTMCSVLENLTRPDSTVTVLLAHANLQDIPFAQLVVLDALGQAAPNNGFGKTSLI